MATDEKKKSLLYFGCDFCGWSNIGKSLKSSPPDGIFKDKGRGSPCSITGRMVAELIPVLGSQPTRDVSHKPGGKLPLLSARPTVTLATIKHL